jgi:predicted DsbA family dithiol-disulfide isomerase
VEGFKLWEQPDDYESKGLLAFMGFQAARRQEKGSFDDFHMALLKLRHEDKRELNQTGTLLKAAKTAGFDLERFREDLSDRSFRDAIGRDYREGAEKYGVFGVPTILFENSGAAFIKLDPIPEGDGAAELLDSLLHLMRNHSWLKELKKPSPPT